MTNLLKNRLDMCRTVIALLDKSEWHPVWQNQRPLIFTQKASRLQAAVTDFADTAAEQEKIITGYAANKESDEAALEDISHVLGEALGEYYLDTNQEQNAYAVDFPLSAWQRLTDESLLNRSRILAASLKQALTDDVETLDLYGLDQADATALAAAISEYEADIASPAAAIATRKAQTAALTKKYRAVNAILTSMDKLIARFATQPKGPDFAATWQASRIIRDIGGSTSTSSPDPTPPSA